MFPDQVASGLRPWQAKKLYVRQGFRPDPEHPPTLRLATGVYDPVLGRSYFEIAMEGRSQHKSQEMGVPELRGPQASAMRLLESLVPHPADETSVFDGLDTSVGGLARLSGLPPGALDTQLASIVRATKAALAQYDPLDPAKIVQPLAEGLRSVRAARAALPTAAGTDDARADADILLGVKELQFEGVLARAAGIVVDPLADAETLAPGETVNVAVRLFLASRALVEVSRVRLLAPTGWLVEEGTPPDTSSSNPFARFFREAPDRSDGFNVTVPADAPYTQPYWLARPRVGDRFEWSDSDPRSLPFAPPLLSARVEGLVGGVAITIDHPVTCRLTDRVRGELRRNVDVVPPVVISLDSQLELVPTTALGQPRRIAVRLQGEADHEQAGSLRLVVPDGWSVSPTDAPFTIPKKGDRTSVVFTLTPAATAAIGRYQIRAEATIDGRRLDRAMRTIAYPHIQTHRMYLPAEAGVRVLDLKVAPVKVGYIMGSGDQVPDAIRRMGLEVTMVDEDQLASSDLSRFDVIVVGIRASEARPDFVGNHGRLLAFVREGGTLIVQYQQIDYAARGLPPFPTEIRSRVTDEEAPVTILVPDHPAFTRPNHIGPSDWSDWVQERNLYAFAKYDPRYVPMLETADPGEPPQRGGQVIASLGRGFYVYTSYAWFRQLPAGVPGAYRLFANLLSLPKTMRTAPPRQP
jgi:hypothetical protein